MSKRGIKGKKKKKKQRVRVGKEKFKTDGKKKKAF